MYLKYDENQPGKPLFVTVFTVDSSPRQTKLTKLFLWQGLTFFTAAIYL